MEETVLSSLMFNNNYNMPAPKMTISVIICTYNPREDYMRRVLWALATQTFPKEHWELLVVEHIKDPSKAQQEPPWDLTWHPDARYILEYESGLTAGRLRGIKESTGKLLIFVDDDNVLDPQYLEKALEIADRFPQIGAFNGSTKGEYEIEPPPQLKCYVEELADLEVKKDYWSNLPCRTLATPIGAGMCIRRELAEDYYNKVSKEPMRKLLGQSGKFWVGGEDLDLAWCAIDAGMGTGRFKDLKIQHLIADRRIDEEYIVRLYACYAASWEILAVVRPDFCGNPIPAWKKKIRWFFDYVRVPRVQRKIMRASVKARRQARKMTKTTLQK